MSKRKGIFVWGSSQWTSEHYEEEYGHYTEDVDNGEITIMRMATITKLT